MKCQIAKQMYFFAECTQLVLFQLLLVWPEDGQVQFSTQMQILRPAADD